MTVIVQLFTSFLKVGLLGFGGGMAIISLIYDEIQKFVKITQEQFANIVAISQATPGPVAVNVATYIGYEAAGVPGALVATLGVALPSFVITIIVCRAIGASLENKYVQGALSGIRPATVGMIASAFVVIAAPTLMGATRIGSFGTELPFDPIAVAICAATVLLVGKFKQRPIVILIIMGCIGAILSI